MNKCDICLSLDGFDSLASIGDRVHELRDFVRLFKIGADPFTAWGPRAIETVQRAGGEVFLDLKYHDIPSTVALAINRAAQLGVKMLTIHCSGGTEMLQAAASAAQGRTLLVGVTVLTSSRQGDAAERVCSLAEQAHASGLDGVVCSGHELRALNERRDLPLSFLRVVPGIGGYALPAGQDQSRTMLPHEAAALGADVLVVGRAINQIESPSLRYLEARRIVEAARCQVSPC